MKRTLAAVAAVGMAVVFTGSAAASHSWGNYHWARTANPFTLKVIDGNSANWDDNLGVAVADWHSSGVLNLSVAPGTSGDRKCRPVQGQLKSCNATYGFNGWLGLAQIWASGSHITQATAKMNDSYLASSSYNETNRQHVMCQEIGHGFGLGHQDESGRDFNTCMDYANSLDNPKPNAHDFDQLQTIYSHLDSTTTVALSPGLAGSANAKPEKTERIDRISSSEITETFRDGTKKITHVLWALGHPRSEHPHHDD